MVALQVAVHPFASVTVKVYVPSARPVVDGLIVYGPVPPLPTTDADPLDPPRQLT